MPSFLCSLDLFLPASAESWACWPRRKGRCTKCLILQHPAAPRWFSSTLLFLLPLDSGGSVRSTPKCWAQKRLCMWGYTQTAALLLSELCFWNSVLICVPASALWGKELVWGGVLWGLLHGLFPPRNTHTVWQVRPQEKQVWRNRWTEIN